MFWKNLEMLIQDYLKFGNHNVFPTSDGVIRSCCGPQGKHFWTYCIPSNKNFLCHSFNTVGAKGFPYTSYSMV